MKTIFLIEALGFFIASLPREKTCSWWNSVRILKQHWCIIEFKPPWKKDLLLPRRQYLYCFYVWIKIPLYFWRIIITIKTIRILLFLLDNSSAKMIKIIQSSLMRVGVSVTQYILLSRSLLSLPLKSCL